MPATPPTTDAPDAQSGAAPSENGAQPTPIRARERLGGAGRPASGAAIRPGAQSAEAGERQAAQALAALGEEWAKKLGEGKCVGLSKALAAQPALIQWADSRGWSLAHWAAWGAPPKAIGWLARAGADMSRLNEGRETPLIVACRRGRAGAVVELLALGAKATETGFFGQSAVELLAVGFAGDPEGESAEGVMAAIRALRAGGAENRLSVPEPKNGADRMFVHFSLIARILGEGVRADLAAQIAEGLVGLGERANDEELEWANRRGATQGAAAVRAAQERELLREATAGVLAQEARAQNALAHPGETPATHGAPSAEEIAKLSETDPAARGVPGRRAARRLAKRI
jgi:hypothetical protein